MYQARRIPQSDIVPIRNLQYHQRVWGPAPAQHDSAKAPLVLVHGWMDVGASFQFVVDALGAPVAGVRLQASPQSGGPGIGSQPTDAGGNFSVGVLDGTWDLQASGGDVLTLGYVFPKISFNVSSGVDITESTRGWASLGPGPRSSRGDGFSWLGRGISDFRLMIVEF